MSAIVIRRCTLRVTRRGGWCWGEDRRALAERITGLVPKLVAERLAELFGDAPAEQEVAVPLRLDVRLTSGATRDPLALAEAVRRALSTWQPPVEPRSAKAAAAAGGGYRNLPEKVAPDSSGHEDAAAGLGSPILRLLSGWREAGTLAMHIVALPENVAAAWFLRLVEYAPKGIGRAAPAAELAGLVEALVARMAAPLAGPEARARAHLFIALEWLSIYDSLPPPGVLMAQLAASLAPPQSGCAPAGSGANAIGAGEIALRESPLVANDRVPAQISSRDLPRAARWERVLCEVPLDSVLPFLVLGMLHRIGWLQVAAAVFEGVGGEEDGAYLAAAIAERLIAPAAIRRAGYDGGRRTVAFFAGLSAAPAAAAMADWGERHRAHLMPISNFVVRTIADGHDPSQPVLLLRAAPEDAAPFILVDCDGGYPLAVADDPVGCARALSSFRASPMLVAREAATPALLAALRADDHAWVTDAPPGRGEAGKRLPGRDALWVAGDMPLARLRAAASQFALTEPLARECCMRLLRNTQPLDRTAFLGAGMGLGLLAWSLWREREPVHPLLALDRLSDLEGVARIDADVIEIRPAIGRRYLDLRDAGALAPIPGTPWLGGRSVRFVGP